MTRSLPRALLHLIAAAALTAGAACSSQLSQTAAQTTRLAVEDGAFATLLYQEEFVIGARVLAYSLKATGTDRDLVLLCTDNISKQAQAALASDGWDVRVVRPIANPGKWTSERGGRKGKSFPSKFWAVYTKLYLFNMTEYRKVVFLDADTLVLQDLEGLFACPGLCAVTRHAEKVNTGVLVITPSHQLFQDLMSAAPVMSSYTGGDQGFLNSFFPNFAAAPMFDPETTAASAVGNSSSLHRLPTAYNADLGLYMIGGHSWTIPRSAIRVMHFTLGPIKPWQWWAPWIADECATWQDVRAQLYLQDASRGISNGKGTRLLAKWVLFPAPLALAGMAMLFRGRSARRLSKLDRGAVLGIAESAGAHAQVPRAGGIQAIAAGFLAVCLGLAVSVAIIPIGLPAIWGWILTYEWTLMVTAGIFGLYLSRLAPTRTSRNALADLQCNCLYCSDHMIGAVIHTHAPKNGESLLKSPVAVQHGQLSQLHLTHQLRESSSNAKQRHVISRATAAFLYICLAVSVLAICPWISWALGVKVLALQVVITSFSIGFLGGLTLVFVFHHLAGLALHARSEVSKASD